MGREPLDEATPHLAGAWVCDLRRGTRGRKKIGGEAQGDGCASDFDRAKRLFRELFNVIVFWRDQQQLKCGERKTLKT